MRTLLIDNYDSFTYNLYQLVAQVFGEPPMVFANDQITWEGIRQLQFDNVIISPGPGRPDRARDFGISARLIREAEVPVLGVCLGHQGIACAFGGRVVQAPLPMHGRLSQVRHDGSRLFDGIPSPFTVVRYHSLMVDSLPSALQVTAQTSDGLPMALAHASRPIFGVQFHPESICAEAGARLIENFGCITRAGWSESPREARTGTPAPTTAVRAPARDAPKLAVHVRKVPLAVSAARCFDRLYAHQPVAFWLDSSLVRAGLSRFSFMGDASGPLAHLLVYDAATRRLRKIRQGREEPIDLPLFEYLDTALKNAAVRSDALPFDFNGGYVGYLGYEMKQECGAAAPHRSRVPDAQLIFADRLLAFDHQEQCLYLVCIDEVEHAIRATEWLDRTESIARDLTHELPEPPTASAATPPSFTLRHPRMSYIEKIEACLHDITQGESYEICLTNKLVSAPLSDPLGLYLRLRRINAAPHAAYLALPSLHVLCSSPERFLRVDRDRVVESKPIKGTARRSSDEAEDRRLKDELAQSEKNRSENLMIVDLVRNDLGRVCDVGSVHVSKLMDVETYATVHQMVSTVRGTLRRDRSAVDAVRAAFPGGSMTGAPKLRTMEIIDALEEEARGVYSGAIGFFALSGACDFNIVIRTICIEPDRTSIGIGGAIIALSEPHEEFDEINLKAQAPARSVLAHTGHAVARDQPITFESTEADHAGSDEWRSEHLPSCH